MGTAGTALRKSSWPIPGRNRCRLPSGINGAFEALPRDRRIPKFRQITVAFGCPEPVETLRGTGDGRTDQERITDAVRQRVIAVGAASAHRPGDGHARSA